jgi:MFS transporter, DHA1 family, tetracycline resistance protein
VVKNISEQEKALVGVKADISQPQKGRSPLLLIFFTVLIDLIGFGLIIPIMPTYARELRADDTMVGLLIASYSVMQFIFMPIWGRLSDKVGRRPMLLLSLAASFAGYLIWGFANSLALLFVSRLVAGAGNANIAVAQAYVTDVTTPENRSKGMGLVFAAFGLGFVLGPALGGLCVSTNLVESVQHLAPFLPLQGALSNLQLVGFMAAFLSLTDLVLTFFLLPEPVKRSQAGTERYSLEPGFYTSTLSDRKLRNSFAIFFISTFAFANMETTLVLLTKDRFGYGPHDNMMLFVYVGILMVLVQGGLVHRLSKKYGEKPLVMLGTLLIGLGLLLTPIGNSPTFLYVALAILAFGSGINTPANQSMLSKLAPQARVGGVLGIGQSLSTLGRILGPLVGGAAYQYLGTGSPYMIGAVAMVVAFLLSFQLPEIPTSTAIATK